MLISGMLTPLAIRAAKEISWTTKVPVNVAANMAKNGAFHIRRFNSLAITAHTRYATMNTPNGSAE